MFAPSREEARQFFFDTWRWMRNSSRRRAPPAGTAAPTGTSTRRGAASTRAKPAPEAPRKAARRARG